MFLSFVIATYNCADRVPVLLRTVRTFAGLPCEFCVSDGGSTDGTVALLQAEPGIRVVCSAPDRGIYDAWNKALGSCTGTYISFIGVDDEPGREFVETALRRFGSGPTQPGLVCGDILLNRAQLFRRVPAPARPGIFNAHEPVFDFPHPGALNHASLFAQNRFSEAYKLAGDAEFYFRVRKQIEQLGYERLDALQAVVEADGLSRSAPALRIYRDEYTRMQAELGVRFGLTLQRLRLMSVLSSIPWLFDLLMRISWARRGRSRHSA